MGNCLRCCQVIWPLTTIAGLGYAYVHWNDETPFWKELLALEAELAEQAGSGETFTNWYARKAPRTQMRVRRRRRHAQCSAPAW